MGGTQRAHRVFTKFKARNFGNAYFVLVLAGALHVVCVHSYVVALFRARQLS